MNYKRIYDSIIENRKANKAEGYTENHHIIPDSLGGSNKKDNMVRLTAKEHFICHLLLTKMYEKGTLEYHKMLRAFIMMSNVTLEHRYISSRKYETLRKEFSKLMSESQTGSNNITYGKMWICNVELKISKMVEKDSILEDGWKKGAIRDWDNYYLYRKCVTCGVSGCMSRMSNYCSKQCRPKKVILPTRPNDVYIDSFIEAYKKCGIVNIALRMIGKGNNSIWAKRIIDEYGLHDVPKIEVIRCITDETRKKISDSNVRTNTSRSKKVSEFNKGKKLENDTKNKLSLATKDRKFINNSSINKFVKIDELEKYLHDGWVLGRLCKDMPD